MPVDLARAIGEPQRTVRLRQATVTAVAADGAASIRFGTGGSVIAGVRTLVGASPVVDATVWVLQQGYDMLILGRISPAPVVLPDGQDLQASWIELRSTGGSPGIDFTRTPGTADLNVRIINSLNKVLEILTTDAADSNTGGRIHVGNAWAGSHPVHGGSGWAGFGHKNMLATGNFGFLQSNAGETIVNAASGQAVNLNLNNASHVIINSTAIRVFNPLNLAGMRIWTKQASDDNHRIQHSTGLDSLEFFSWGEHRFITQNVLNQTMNSDGVYTTGKFKGAWGGNGGAFRDRSGDNIISFDWDGTLRIHVDNAGSLKNFIIDHPLDKTKYLVHACIEGPEATVFYRGQGQLGGGWVEIKLPDYFEALCEEEGRSVQLTCIADDPADEWCPVLHATYPKKGRFFVGLGSGMAINDQRFWWEVKAVRRNAVVNVEPKKSDIVVMGEGPYTWYKERTA